MRGHVPHLVRKSAEACCFNSLSQPVQLRNFSSSFYSNFSITKHHQLKHRLPDAIPSWSFRRNTLAIAVTNANLRRCPVRLQDLQKLRSLDPRMEDKLEVRRKYREELKVLQDELASWYLRKDDSKTKNDGDSSNIIPALHKRVKDLKALLGPLEYEYAEMRKFSQTIRLQLPNFTSPKSPIGSIDNAIMVGKGGDSKLLSEEMRNNFDSTPLPISLKEIPQSKKFCRPDQERDHMKLATLQGWIDTNANQMVAGTSWPILSGPLAALEHALVSYGMKEACKANFKPIVVPDVIRREIVERTGFTPREGSAGQIYWLSSDSLQVNDKSSENYLDDLALAATAEIPLAGMLAKKIYEPKTDLPQQFVASSHAFRAEAGARGLESKGLYRVHQFTKVEMFVVCESADSQAWLEKLRSIQEGIIGKLGFPYRVLNMPTEELGASAYAKYDIEAWMPGRGSWGEVSSASNCTDYQSNRLHIRCKLDIPGRKGNTTDFVHTLNGTVIAVPRVIVALLENYGVTKTGKLRIPSVLKEHWHSFPQDQVEWIGKEEGKTTLQSAVDRIRRASEKSGTDFASMVISFLILHELTAILPLILLFYLFGLLGVGEQVMAWLMQVSDDESGVRGWLRGKINEGMQKVERYGRKKGLFGFEAGTSEEIQDNSIKSTSALVGTFANAVAAYAITKALFPLRIGASVALAGPFARLCIEPFKRLVRKMASRSKKR